MMNMPIMPSPIWVISSKCGWYMYVPAGASVNSYLKVSPGGMGFWVSPATPSMPLGKQDAVPVDAGRLGEPVGDVDANAVAFDRFDRRPGRAAVVTPAFGLQSRGELVLDLLGDQVKDLHAVDDLERQGACRWA